MAHLILIRGLPGSGKSTFAKLFGFNHFEADQYFEDVYGSYIWDASKLREAHSNCFNNTCYALRVDQDTVVSNTFTTFREMQPYIEYARDNDHKLTVIKCEGNYGSVHNVPEEAIQRMRDRWEDY